MALSQALGQTLPLQIDQKATLYNYQSYSGVPLSDVLGPLVKDVGSVGSTGSNGKAPSILDQQGDVLTEDAVTTPQFSGFLGWSALASPQTPEGLKDGIGYSQGNAENIGLPHGGSGSSRMTMLRARVGAPFLNRPVS
ncbi:MAG: hypothetical protein OSB07_11230, partial [Dehalococcoidia bacterium]|nr:hypothetical protein [Dehalococcoidia bacterium]